MELSRKPKELSEVMSSVPVRAPVVVVKSRRPLVSPARAVAVALVTTPLAVQRVPAPDVGWSATGIQAVAVPAPTPVSAVVAVEMAGSATKPGAHFWQVPHVSPSQAWKPE